MDYTIVNIAADIFLNVYNGNKSAVMGLLSLFFTIDYKDSNICKTESWDMQ